MTPKECQKELLDFIHDRGRFKSGRKLEGMAVSEKPILFVDYYVTLSEIDRRTMNTCLIYSLLGKDEQTKTFIGITAMVLGALVDRVDGTGLDAFQSELMHVLQDPQKRSMWVDRLGPSSDFREDWRYPLSIMNILSKLNINGVREIAIDMASVAKSQQFRMRLSEIAANA
jgi:hypothetical protein